MKTKMRRVAAVLLWGLMFLCMTACSKDDETDLWENARYTEDTELGEGSKTVTVVVEAQEKKVTLTIHSDALMLGDALTELELIEGDEGPYGLYLKRVNGILADFDVDQTYWGFYQKGEYMMTGVDMTEFADGDQYELVREKQ